MLGEEVRVSRHQVCLRLRWRLHTGAVQHHQRRETITQCCGAGAGRSRSRCKDVKAKTCFLLLFRLFLYEKKPQPEPVKKKYLEPEQVKKGLAPQHWVSELSICYYLKSDIFCIYFILYLHMWIRIRIQEAPEYASNTDLDPRHCFLILEKAKNASIYYKELNMMKWKIVKIYFQNLETQHKNVLAHESWVQLSLNHEKNSGKHFLKLAL